MVQLCHLQLSTSVKLLENLFCQTDSNTFALQDTVVSQNKDLSSLQLTNFQDDLLTARQLMHLQGISSKYFPSINTDQP